MSHRREVRWVVPFALLAIMLWSLIPTYPNYDAYYHLLWGREAVRGVTPSFTVYAAPTEHPLYVVIGGLMWLLAGAQADRALVLFSALSLVALVWAVYRLALVCFGRWPARASTLFVASSFALLLFAARAYVDVPFLALVLWAGALEAERPARERSASAAGRLPMTLLLVAGLLRPEAWVLAGLYWLWCGWRRWDLLVLAAVAPLIWAAVDWAVTGDPLHSLHATSKLADDLGRERGLIHVPGAFVSFLASVARPPVAAAGVIGMVLAARDPNRRSLHVPFALFGAGTITFVLSGAAGLSILPRYLTVPVVALCLFAGYAALGFTGLAPGSVRRRRWSRLIWIGAAVGLVFVVAKVSVADRLVTELRFIRSTHADLRAVLRSDGVTRGRACGPISFPNYRLVPDTRWILDLPAGAVVARSDRHPVFGVDVVTVGKKTTDRYGKAAGTPNNTNHADAGFVLVARDGAFAAYARCP